MTLAQLKEKKKIAILGSTGSIGTQALEVVREQSDYLQVEVLTAQNNAELLIAQAREFKPDNVVIGNTERYLEVKDALADLPIKVFAGGEALNQVAAMGESEIVLTAMVGFAGLEPTMSAIGAGKHIALANKETLVVAGDLVTKAAREKGVNIYPVDSEHSAIFQCLSGEWNNPIEKIVLTASGGPFRGYTTERLQGVTRAQALKHPNWSMGSKITIDSATLMNKGLEVIEAKWLFSLNPDQIEVVVHPQSIVHSIVQFQDGSMKAQMGLPDMKLPIQYAIAYPQRLSNTFPRFSFSNFNQLTFESPDVSTFDCLQIAFDALHRGGNAPCIVNAANEVAVELFLKEEISFLEIPQLIRSAMNEIAWKEKCSLEEYKYFDKESRMLVRSQISKKL